jgi:hypothetical protein
MQCLSLFTTMVIIGMVTGVSHSFLRRGDIAD